MGSQPAVLRWLGGVDSCLPLRQSEPECGTQCWPHVCGSNACPPVGGSLAGSPRLARGSRLTRAKVPQRYIATYTPHTHTHTPTHPLSHTHTHPTHTLHIGTHTHHHHHACLQVKSAEPVLSVGLSQLILGEKNPYYVWLSLLPIIAGCSLAAMKEVREGITSVVGLLLAK